MGCARLGGAVGWVACAMSYAGGVAVGCWDGVGEREREAAHAAPDSAVPGLWPVPNKPSTQIRPTCCCCGGCCAGVASLPSLEAGAEAAAAEYVGSGRSSPSGEGSSGSGGWYCGAYIAPEGTYCQRANTLQGYADVNRWGWAAGGWQLKGCWWLAAGGAGVGCPVVQG